MALFSKKGSADGERGNGHNGGAGSFKRDPRKASAFFKHAETTADSSSYDYSIECYVNGLRHDPDNLPRHEELREVARKRRNSGGKAATLSDRLKGGGKTPVDKMLQSEKLWSMSPLDVAGAIKTFRLAVECIKAEPDLEMAEVAYWVGENTLELAQIKPNADHLVQICNLFEQIPAYDKAVEACQMAVSITPGNADLLKRLKNLETELTLHHGHYGSGKKGDFRDNIKDTEQQRILQEDDAITKTESMVDSTLARRREEYEQSPDEPDALKKLVAALMAKNDESSMKEAVELLNEASKKHQQYSYKMQAGDIEMRLMRRELRQAQQCCTEHPDDTNAKQQWEELNLRVVKHELDEFLERAKQYPTNMRVRFELGRRHFSNQQYDEAISEFQKVKTDPKHSAASCEYLGRCYIVRGWFDEAITVLEEGIEKHAIPDDRMGMELHYLSMEAMEKSAREMKSHDRALGAQKMASKILQTDINYRDIRHRMDELKKLVVQLQQK